MSTERGISLLVGSGGGFFAMSTNPTPESTKQFLSFLPKYNIKEIDTAAVYPSGTPGNSEKLLGLVHAAKDFIIDTKIMVKMGSKPPGPDSKPPSDGEKGELSREKVLESFNTSLERLGVEKVRTLYCHRPDPETPLEETAGIFNELYEQGKFEHVCLSSLRLFLRLHFVRIMNGGTVLTFRHDDSGACQTTRQTH
jgi:aryl-alcohol dehydrogenase-like predicted oxidoreductase